ncbi:MAG: hypothetical protein K6F20_02570 [Bacteroidaceae bacterium]|nr:hypothetical protein [Bacteroidaceae bacterium]
MRKYLMALVLGLVSLSASAQFECGKKYANMSLTGLDMSYMKGSEFHFGLAGQGGYFVAQDWMVGGKLGYDYVGGASSHMFDLGANVRYYFEASGIYLDGGLLYQHQNFGAKQNWLSIVPEVGYCFFLNEHVTIEPAIYCNLCLNEFENGSKVGFKIGFGFYF